MNYYVINKSTKYFLYWDNATTREDLLNKKSEIVKSVKAYNRVMPRVTGRNIVFTDEDILMEDCEMIYFLLPEKDIFLINKSSVIKAIGRNPKLKRKRKKEITECNYLGCRVSNELLVKK